MISVIIPILDEAKFAIAQASFKTAMANEPWELIEIRDVKSFADAYNQGAARAQGETIIFAREDIEILTPDLPAKIKSHLNHFDLIGVAGTDRLTGARWQSAGPGHLFGQIAHARPEGKFRVDILGAPSAAVGNIQALDGHFLAARRATVQQFAFDAVTFDGLHVYDIDFSMQLHRANQRLGVACDIALIHPQPDDFGDNWRVYADRFKLKWHGQLNLPIPVLWARITTVEAPSRQEALQRMTPAYWTEEQ